jgi:hypothetical protein|tara:strand:- start:194 stop:844 length:651 start_codon:yes stop_codon:yes gene_type:complete
LYTTSKIKALLINRNLLTTFKNTLEFLRKEPRVEIHILDQESTYPPLLEFYKTITEEIHYAKNEGPYSAWDPKYEYLRKGYFIVADTDCIYDNVPDDWLDVMLHAINQPGSPKIGFSLEIEDLPNTDQGKQSYAHEAKYWENKIDLGWDAHVDTTFALYRANLSFSYNGIRLDKPYCIQHAPWYIDDCCIPEEWQYYLDHANHISTWGTRIKKSPN